MKIAFIGQKGIPSISGGVEKYVEDLSTHIASYGHDVIVYTRKHYTPKKKTNFKGVGLISLPSINTKHLDAITHTFLASIDILRRKIDIVHYQSIGSALVCWIPKLLNPRIKVIATLQSRDYEHQKWNGFAKFILKLGERIMCYCSDEIIVVSQPMIKYVKDTYNREAHCIPNGSNLYPRVGADKIKKWGLVKGNYIVAISRIVRHKGLGYLISAYKQLDTDKKLVIVGGSAFTDDYVSELKTLAEDNPNIIFTGSQTGTILAQLYENAHIFVQPSESEGLSLALLEAMARRKATLVSDIMENIEAVGENSVVFRNKDIEDLTKKLDYLLNNPEVVKELEKVNRSRIVRIFNWDIISKDMIKLYKQSVDKNKRSVFAVLKGKKSF